MTERNDMADAIAFALHQAALKRKAEAMRMRAPHVMHGSGWVSAVRYDPRTITLSKRDYHDCTEASRSGVQNGPAQIAQRATRKIREE